MYVTYILFKHWCICRSVCRTGGTSNGYFIGFCVLVIDHPGGIYAPCYLETINTPTQEITEAS